MLLYRYISYHYLKYFLIILSALVGFMVGLDFMTHSDDLPNSANLILLYIMYKAFFGIDLMGPLSLVFGMIATKVFLIRSNALVALYSLGYSKTDILKPFVSIATLLIVLFIALHTTSFARADENAESIRVNSKQMQPTENLFFTYEDQYVYFGHLYPLQQRAEDVRIFRIRENHLQDVIVADHALYSGGYWHVSDARMIRKPQTPQISGEGIDIAEHQSFKVLKGFKPKILDQVYEGKVNFTIFDAIDALMLLNRQNVNVDRIKSALYRIFVHPLFVPCVVVIIFFFVPMSSRFLNLSLFSFGAILATLLVWGVMFSLIELSNAKTIPSEIGIVMPVLILFVVALVQWRRSCARL
jgi:lipopolysaccharide export system permease protein